jgi:hypothetical protein
MKKLVFSLKPMLVALLLGTLVGCGGLSGTLKPAGEYAELERAELAGADAKISDLAESTAAANDDLLAGVDVSDDSMAASGTTKGYPLWLLSGYFGLIDSVTVGICEGEQDDGAAGSNLLILTHDGATWTTDAYKGMTLYNVTDVSSCTVASNTAETMTCEGYSAGSSSGLTGAGGTDFDWDDNDVWAVGPGPHQSGMVFYITAATTILHPATVGYAAMYYTTGDNIIKVDPASSSMQFYLNGDSTGTAGEELDSPDPGNAGDFITIHNQSATVGRTMGASGTWTDGGES